MPSPGINAQRIRIRPFKPKVITGCKTCRIRRIKCDEAKPSCRRCTNTGRKCDWYSLPSRGPSTSSSSVTSTASQTGSISPSILLTLFTNSQERRSFSFFCEYTVHQISGAFDAEFWRYLVLQASHHEAAIRHAACALGAMHEHFELYGSNNNEVYKRNADSQFAVQQYLKAIVHLLDPMKRKESQAADVALTTCVIFICIETLRGNYGAAISHIDGGVKIISELQNAPSPTPTSTSNLSISSIPYIPLSALNLMFIRLDVQGASIIPQRRRRLLSPSHDDSNACYEQHIPRSFSSVEEARNSLAYMHTANARRVPAARPTIPFDHLKKAKIVVNLELRRSVAALSVKMWSEAFQSFIDRNSGKIDNVVKQAILILKIQKIMMNISLKLDSLKALHDETAWDVFKSEYETVVSLASECISLTKRSCRKHISFNFDGGVIFPLCAVAVKCRDHHIRHRAIELLKSDERVEGIFNSLVVARVVERLVAIEEEVLRDGTNLFLLSGAENIVREKRVAEVEIDFATETREAHLKYQRFVPDYKVDGLQTRPVVIVDEWVEL